MLRQCLVAMALAVAGTGPATAQEVRTYVLGTATTGGTYYPVGVAIEALVKVVLRDAYGVELQARATGGSSNNLELLTSGDIQIAMVQGIHTRSEATGEELAGLRSISMLWPDVIHVLVRSDLAATGSIHDLAAIGDGPVAIGRADSGARVSTEIFLSKLGIDTKRLNVVDVGGYDAVATAFESGEIDAASMLGGVPMAAITRAMTAPDRAVAFLGFSDDDIAAINDGIAPLWIPYVVAVGTYPGQGSDIVTIAEPNALLVRDDVPADDVYLLTKAMFENLAFLGNMHPAAREITTDHALLGMVVPLHPGAARYFEEIGLTIPEVLLPPDG